MSGNDQKIRRREQILAVISQHGFITVGELAGRFFISEPTVRRELASLEAEGVIRRSHGGASPVSNGLRQPIAFRKTSCLVQKRKIGQAAAELVCDGDIIFIDTSTTALMTVEHLRSRYGVIVVTNSLAVMEMIAEMHLPADRISCRCTGGELNGESFGLVGSTAEQYVSGIRFDKFFFSTPCVSETGRISDFSERETYLRRTVLGNTRESVFLFDAEKLGKEAVYTVSELRRMTYIVTDAPLDQTVVGTGQCIQV